MRVCSIFAENFMLHRNFRRVFSDKDIIGIVGEHEGAGEQSNRSGKTNCIEMVLFALTGHSRAGQETELIRRGADHMLVELVLIDKDNKKITVRRGRDIKGNGLLEVSGIEKVGEAQAEINRITGLNKNEMLLTNFFSQGDINQFMELGATDKKRYLMSWLQNSHWVDREKQVLGDLNSTMKKLESIRARSEALNSQSNDTKELKALIEKHRQEIASFTKRRAKLQLRLDSLKETRSQQKLMRSQISEIEVELVDLSDKMDEHQAKLEELEKAEQVCSTLQKQLAERPDNSKNESQWRKQLATLLMQRSQLASTIRASEKHEGQCPVLKEACSRIKPTKAQINAWRKLDAEWDRQATELQEWLDALEAREAAISDLQEARERVQALRADLGGCDSIAVSLKRLGRKKKELEGSISDSVEDRIGQVQSKLDSLQQRILSSTDSVASMVERLNQQKKIAKEKQELGERATKLERKISLLRYVAFMFGKSGIPSQEIENAFGEIEEEMNFVLSQLGTNMRVEFKADRELGTWEDMCAACGSAFPKSTRVRECETCGEERRKKRKDELQIRILDDGADEAFHMESGSGKALISIANRIANARLIQRRTGSDFNVLFLDECDAMFDQVSRQAFVKLITTTLTKKLGYEQIFIVSHDKEIQNSVPHALMVTRRGDYSTTRWL